MQSKQILIDKIYKNIDTLEVNISATRSIGQNPHGWFMKQNIEHIYHEIFDTPEKVIKSSPPKKNIDTPFVKYTLLKFMLGDVPCHTCSNIVEQFWSYNLGFNKFCSYDCKQSWWSKRQKLNNTCNRMTAETAKASREKQSRTLRKLILDGKYTPKSENYKRGGIIKISNPINGVKYVRSTWELIFHLINPDYEYETIRLPYYDTILKKDRVYIVDFYDPITNTLYEIKPSKFEHTLMDKITGVNKTTYNFKIINEHDIYKLVNDNTTMMDELPNLVEDYETMRSRMQWVKKLKV